MKIQLDYIEHTFNLLCLFLTRAKQGCAI